MIPHHFNPPLAHALRLAAAALVLGPLWPGPAAAQGGSASENEFANQKVGKLATTGADYLCERLFDSVDPVGMLVELGSIVGPRILLGQVPEMSGITPRENQKIFDDLRRLARTKIWLPVSAEKRLGDLLHAKYERDGALIPATALNARDGTKFRELEASLNALAATLPADSPYRFKLNVIQGELVNASVGVGGYVYVTQGLLRDRTLSRNDGALRLAHEIAHMTRRHALKDIQLKFIDALQVKNDISDMLGVIRDPVATFESVLKTVKATQLLFQRFEQNQELESDACGMQVLRGTAGFDAAAALKAYMAQRPAGSAEGAWESSHPPHEEREYVMRMQFDDGLRARHLAQRKGPGTAGPLGGAAGAGATSAGTRTPPPAATSGTAAPGNVFDRLKGMLPSLPASGAERTEPTQ